MHTNKIFQLEIELDQIEINKDEVIRLLGYENNDRDEMVNRTLNKLVDAAYHLISPKACFVVLERQNYDVKGELKINQTIFNIGNIINSQIMNSENIALFICTAGNGIEKCAKELMKNNEMLDSYIMDLIGSEVAETIADSVHLAIKEEAERYGLKITNRFSPGYCNWNVIEQFKLFSFFIENNCNIKLTQSALMDPIKSVSGMVGIGKEVAFKKYKCSACDDEKCIYRRMGR